MSRPAMHRLDPRSWTLRSRLVVSLVALLTMMSLVIGLAGVLGLRAFLLHRVDQQLVAAVSRSESSAQDRRPRPSGEADDHDGDGPRFLLAPGQGEGTLGAQVDRSGRVTSAAVIGSDGNAVPLSVGQVARLDGLPVDRHPRTRDLGGDLGTYRLVAARVPDGDVVVTGLPTAPADAAVSRLAMVALLVTFAGLALAAMLATVIVRWTLRPLRRVAATATRVVGLPLDRGEVALSVRVPEEDTDPRTEVGQVGVALNRMLGHVASALDARQASEMRVRRFVADASHELRTPLASIRGYAELTRRSGSAVPPDVSHALNRVESEAVRMTALVDDLLLLARLDEGRPVDHDPVDLSAVVVDTVTDAHAAGPDHRWEVDLPEDPVVVAGDAPRLHQVVANLLANARTHTPPGTHVLVTLRPHPDDRTAELRVADDGPGIPESVRGDVFERFARADASRTRVAGGSALGSTGLGLAIVAAVVEAHDGTVDVESVPGRTAFVVRLPLASPDEAAAPARPAEGADADGAPAAARP